jgi:hypothetical protein
VELNLLLEQDDLKWKQMAKVNWLRSEDKNTKFYYACVNQRRHKNNIENILDGRGRLCTTQQSIGNAFTEFYLELFKSDSPHNVEQCISAIAG